MIIHPNFDPVALQIGPIGIHWYGLMYVFGFLGVYLLGNYRVNHYSDAISGSWNSEQISDLIFYGALGAVIGGRLGYVLFYKPAEYLANPVDIIYINQGGMSFHGGLLGVILAMAIYARRTNRTLFQIGDFIAPIAPIGLFFGRMGNFINQELWGKPTDLPWGMVFSTADSQPRHPSMLYEAFMEGLLLLLIIWLVARRPRAAGVLSGLFLIGYAVSRFLVEFVRVPDEHLDYLFLNWVTMGQLLSMPMLLLGLFLVLRRPKLK
jgi:phosphatidylglycerol:prolipoprotein diacylglycerol transferase